ncbi:MAG TPA: cystathionine gamma-lyase [Burkholderiaceae bacterium]|nr:cystathionine gamma-lyase [Burkholderiaceae bacterium]
MSDLEERFARALHHASQSTAFGEAFTPPIVNTSVYRLQADPSGPYQYARWGNPTWTALEETLALLEDAETVTFPSGMAAIAAVFYALLKPGDRVLLPSDGYYTVRVFAEKFLASFGVAVDQVGTAGAASRALDGYRMVWVETPSNPGLDLADIVAIARNAKAAGALLVVDNTTMTPLGQRPLDLGADLIVSADTKALNGHSDVLFGHVSSRKTELIGAVRDWRRVAGAIPGPFEAWLVHRGLETLEVRFARASANALLLAERLSAHPKVRALGYPGLASHPAHALARAQMSTGGSLIALTLADRAAAERFIERCDLMRASTSFGGVHTSAERRARWGDAVAEGFIRVSVGCEPGEALWRAVERALAAV